MQTHRKLPLLASIESRLTAWKPLERVLDKLQQQRKKVHRLRQWLKDRHEPRSLRNFERKVFSQHGEDGIIDEIFRRIGEGQRFAVEFGIEDGTECNTRYLFEQRGWSGVLLDGSSDYAASARKLLEGRPVRVLDRFITTENIVSLFEEGGVPPEPDLLSIDVDGNDYWLWQAASKAYRPRVVVIEYNGRWVPPKEWIMPYDPVHRWDGSVYFGASLASFEKLGRELGYRLVGCDSSGGNAFFVREDLVGDHFPGIEGGTRRLYSAPLYARGFGHPTRPKR